MTPPNDTSSNTGNPWTSFAKTGAQSTTPTTETASAGEVKLNSVEVETRTQQSTTPSTTAASAEEVKTETVTQQSTTASTEEVETETDSADETEADEPVLQEGKSVRQKISELLKQIKLFLTKHIKATMFVLCLISVGLAIRFYLPLEIMRVNKERDNLRKKLFAIENQMNGLSNLNSSVMIENDALFKALRSNDTVRVKSSSTNTLTSNTNTPDITVESSRKLGSSLVTVNDNHGDIRIIIKDGEGGSHVRTLKDSSYKAEDVITDFDESTSNKIRTETKTILAGNDRRYYIPEGWSVNFKYYCSENDFETFINKGSRQIPKWETVDVSSGGTTESILIRNISQRSINLTFKITKM